jgi:hypothetical protein
MKRLGLCIALAGCGTDTARSPEIADADPAIDAAPPREVMMSIEPLQATELVEGIMHGSPGDRASIHLEAPSANLDWNIHGHAGGGTQTVHEELKQMTVDFDYTPSATADWFLLLRNSGPTNMEVKVTVKLYGEMTWRWQS